MYSSVMLLKILAAVEEKRDQSLVQYIKLTKLQKVAHTENINGMCITELIAVMCGQKL